MDIKWFYKTEWGRLTLASIWCVIFGTLADNVHDDFIIPMYIGLFYFIIIFGIMAYHGIKNLINWIKEKIKKWF